jgi:RimJ/RimL family protein N-acetyltransferase
MYLRSLTDANGFGDAAEMKVHLSEKRGVEDKLADAATRAIPEGHRLLVRPFEPGDARPMHEAARESIRQLCEWMTWCRAEYSIKDAELFVSTCTRAWQKSEHFSFAIVDAQTGTFLGSAGLNHLNFTHKLANLGYWIRSSANGRGVATAALHKVAEFGLTELGLQRLEFLVPALNFASQRVAQKVGAKFEGVLRDRLVIGGKSHDAVMYSLVKSDLENASAQGANVPS